MDFLEYLKAAAVTTAAENETVTRELWQSAPSAELMLALLADPDTFDRVDITSLDQQLRLFAAWCARHTSRLSKSISCAQAVQVAELFAAGAASIDQIEIAHAQANESVRTASHFYQICKNFIEASLQSNQTEISVPQISTIPSRSDIEQIAAHFYALGSAPNMFFSIASLHARHAAAQATAHAIGTTGGIRAATKCAQSSRLAIYWEMLSRRTDPELIIDTLDEEHRHQAEALRTFIGNPFDNHNYPALTLSPSQSIHATPPAAEPSADWQQITSTTTA